MNSSEFDRHFDDGESIIKVWLAERLERPKSIGVQ